MSGAWRSLVAQVLWEHTFLLTRTIAITGSSLNTASNTSTCNSALRLVGSIDLDTDLVMSDSVKTYNLTWIIRKMGIFVQNGGTAPNEFFSGPFVPNFDLGI